MSIVVLAPFICIVCATISMTVAVTYPDKNQLRPLVIILSFLLMVVGSFHLFEALS